LKLLISIQDSVYEKTRALSIIATVGEWLQLEVDIVKSVPPESMIARNNGMLVPWRVPLPII